MAAIGTFLTVISSSCKKDAPVPVPPSTTIVDVASGDTTFSILVAAVVKTNLAGALSDPAASLTVFAPVNSAFRALGYPTAAFVTSSVTSEADIAKLKKILLYHVLASKVPSSGITGVNTAVVTLQGASLYATKNANGVFVNAVKVIKADVAASNGVIHAIGKVLIPPAGTLLETAVALSADTSPAGFSLLVAAVLQADKANPAGAVTAALSGAGPLTVFAPTNKAFSNAGFPTIASINAASPATLRNIILYHVVGARVFSSDLTASDVTTVQGDKVTIALPAGGATVKGKTNTSASAIILTDVVATNGVIHVIDQVLTP